MRTNATVSDSWSLAAVDAITARHVRDAGARLRGRFQNPTLVGLAEPPPMILAWSRNDRDGGGISPMT